MLRRVAFVLALGLVAIGSGWLRADDVPKKGYEVETHFDVAYRSDKEADPVKHKLDLFIPKGKKDFPVLLFVHGGAWKWGNKELYRDVGQTFARQGIGAVVINYRLSDKSNTVKHPDHIKDVASAFAWVHANIGKHGGRNDRIFVSGHSAGAHLVALLATDETYLKEHKLGLENIRGVIPLSGVYDITPGFFVYNGPFGKDPEICKAASPINQVKGKGHPPFLICYAARDFPTIDKMSENFCKKLTDGKCEASAVKIDDRSHISIIVNLATTAGDPCTSAMLDFIAKHSEWKRR